LERQAPLTGRSFVARRPFDDLRTSLHRRAGLSGTVLPRVLYTPVKNCSIGKAIAAFATVRWSICTPARRSNRARATLAKVFRTRVGRRACP